MKARDLMTSNPEVVTGDEPLSHAVKLMRSLDVGAVPVVEDRTTMRLAGMLTDRDIVLRHVAEGHREDCPIRHAMTRRESPERFVTARPEDTAEYVMDLMAEHQVRRIPVVQDGDDRLVGIIALADVAREVGPRAPAEVVKLLEAISNPTRDLAPVSAG